MCQTLKKKKKDYNVNDEKFCFRIIKNRIQKFQTIPNRLAVVLVINLVYFAFLSFGLLKTQLYPVLDAFYRKGEILKKAEHDGI